MYKLVDNDLFHYVPYYLMSNRDKCMSRMTKWIRKMRDLE